MPPIPVRKLIEVPMKGRILLFALIVLLGCSAGHNEKTKAVPETFEIGESVYVCGCPMMCCNSISRSPGGRCTCNVPLKQGTISRIQGGIAFVKVSGREKPVFIKNR
ncbi:MAG: hypothetical protein ACM34C_02795 [Syntrophaceae bacterium]